MERKKIISAIVSVFAAVLLWSYVINVVNPTQTQIIKAVPVQLVGIENLEDNSLTIAGSDSFTVDVTVSASRTDLAGIKENDIFASADVSSLSAGQNYVTVNVQTPDNLTVESVHSQKIQLFIDELVSESIPVDVVYTDVENADREVTILGQSADSLEVRGAKSVVDTVKSIRVDLDVSELEYDIDQTENLIPIALDAEGNMVESVTLSAEEIAVTAAVYSVKTVPLKLSYTGKPGLGAEISSVKLPSNVLIKANSTLLEAINSIQAENINIEGITQDISVDVKCELPEDVYLADSNKTLAAKFILVHRGEISFSYQPDQILTEYIADGLILEEITQSVTVTAKGELDVVRALEAKDLQPVLDLNGLGEGKFNVNVETLYPPQNELEISFSPETIEVTLTGEQSPEE